MTSGEEEFLDASQGHAPGAGLAHRMRQAAILDVEGADREAFLQGQLTQEVRDMVPGEVRPAAALTPKGKVFLLLRLLALSDRFRLLLPGSLEGRALAHFLKYALFQKVTISNRSNEFSRVGLYGPRAGEVTSLPEEALLLPGEGEFARELLFPISSHGAVDDLLARLGSAAVTDSTAEVLRIEAGRPRYGVDADESNLPDEIGAESSISRTKGCYVGQEVVARLRTYGRVNRRLVGFRFPDGLVPAGSRLSRPGEEPGSPSKIEAGRVTSSAVSPRFGPIGLGLAFRDIAIGGRLTDSGDPRRPADVVALPFG